MPDRIGPYELRREIGRGGMGVVHLAHDPRLGRDVAIKSLPPELAADPGRLERFEREARVLAQLDHPNVARILGVEEHDGQRYLVLEHVEGVTLAERLDRGPLPLDEALEVCIGIARGLEAAHDAGIVHRDLKPANVRITPDGAVKVLDFGLARADDGASSTMPMGAAEGPTVTVPPPTQPGVILGTAAYMSPEQARGRRVDRRTDVWSFGVVLHECLTGANPFQGESAGDSIGAVLHKDVDLGRLPETTPALVRHVLRRCLVRDRDERLRDIGDVRLELSRAARGESAPVAPAAPSSRRLAGVLASFVAGLVLAGASMQLLRDPAPAPAVVRSSLHAPEGVAIVHFDIAPDGGQVAIIGEPAELTESSAVRGSALYVRDLDEREMRKVPGSEGVKTFRYAPDGSTIAFITRGADDSDPGRLLRVPRDGSSPPIEVLRVPPAMRWGGSNHWFGWTLDGRIAMIDRGRMELVTIDAGTGREQGRVALVDATNDGTELDGIAGPFDEGRVAVFVSRFRDTGYETDMALIDLESGVVTRVIEGGTRIVSIPDGGVLYARGETIERSDFDRATLAPIGAPRPVEAGLGTGLHWDDGAFALAANGTLAFVGGGVQGAHRRLVLLDRDGARTNWFDETRAFEDAIAVSPDGARLAVLVTGVGGLYELWVSELERPRLRRLLAFAGGDVLSPVFTADGEHLVVGRWSPRDAEPGQLLLVRFDGTEAPRRLWGGWTSDTWVRPESISPDGTRVLLSRHTRERSELLDLPLEGEAEPTPLVSEAEIQSAHWSPPPLSLLAYVSTETGRTEAFVRTVRDGAVGPPVPVTTRGARRSTWMVDETEGPCLLHSDLEWREWRTPIAMVDGRIRIGDAVPTGRRGDPRIEVRATMRDGRQLVILKGDDERPADRLEIVQGWLQSVAGRR